jgi:hypothetical protein
VPDLRFADRRGVDDHGQVVLAPPEPPGHLDHEGDEHALVDGDPLSVEVHRARVVDAVELQERPLPRRGSRCAQPGAVHPGPLRHPLRQQALRAHAGIGHLASGQQVREDGAGHPRGHPDSALLAGVQVGAVKLPVVAEETAEPPALDER